MTCGLASVQLSCFVEKHRCVFSPFFLSLPEALYSEGCRHTHTEVLDVWGTVQVEFQFTATVTLEKSPYFWNKRRKKKRKIARFDDVLPYDLYDKFSVKIRKAHSDWMEKCMFELMITRLTWRKHSLTSQISCICEWSIETENWEQFLSPATILRQHCSVV